VADQQAIETLLALSLGVFDRDVRERLLAHATRSLISRRSG
jgi:hypothetical protein